MKSILKTIVVTSVVVFVGCVLDVAFLGFQATQGKPPFKFKIFPNIGE
jgi:hypothetical protein